MKKCTIIIIIIKLFENNYGIKLKSKLTKIKYLNWITLIFFRILIVETDQLIHED